VAITTSNPDGVRITTAAKDSRLAASVLGAQGAINADQVVVPNGISTNNQGNLATTPSYVGRLIMIRPVSEGAVTVAINAVGSSYVANDKLILSGGTSQNAAVLNVDTVDGGGAITSVSITSPLDQASPYGPGSYTVTPSNPVSHTGGTGSGASFNMTWASNEEVRYITTDASNTLTVHEDWTQIPVRNEDWAVCYIIADAATVTGLTLISKRVQDYSSGRKFRVGATSGADLGWFGLLDGASLETVDNSSTTDADFKVEALGRLDNGYLASETPVAGGYLIGTPAVDGEMVFDAVSGAECYLNDFFITCVKQNLCQFNGTVNWEKAKFFSASYNMDLTGDLTILQNSSIEGKGTTNDSIEVDSSTVITEITIISTNGFDSPDDAATETIELRNVTFVGNLRHVWVHDDKIWKFVNPVGWINTSTYIVFETNDLNSVELLFGVDLQVNDTAGTGVDNANIYVYEGTLNQNLPTDNRVDTDAAGYATTDVLKEEYTYPASVFTTSTSGDFALKVYKWLKQPITRPLSYDSTKTGNNQEVVVLVADGNINETTQATAITNGSGITITDEGTNAATLLSYDTGTIAFSADDVVTGATSGASGTVVEVTEGDTTSGRLFLKSRNALSFSAGENLQVSAVTRAKATNPLVALDFTWWIDCNSYSLQVVYDYIQARLAEDTPSATAVSIIEWGEDEWAQPMFLNTNGWKSERNVNLTEGWFLANKGTGTIDVWTSDDGTEYNPPVTRNFIISNLKSGSEVRVYRTSDDEQLGGTESSGTSYTYQYSYTSDIPIYFVVVSVDYLNLKQNGTLLDQDQTTPVSQIPDGVFSDPA